MIEIMVSMSIIIIKYLAFIHFIIAFNESAPMMAPRGNAAVISDIIICVYLDVVSLTDANNPYIEDILTSS